MWSHYRPGVAQRVGRGIALLFHDHGTSRGWVVSSTPQPYLTLGKDQVPILQEAGWAPGLVWTGKKSCPQWDSILDCPARSQLLYWLSYPAHNGIYIKPKILLAARVLKLVLLHLNTMHKMWIFCVPVCLLCLYILSDKTWKVFPLLSHSPSWNDLRYQVMEINVLYGCKGQIAVTF